MIKQNAPYHEGIGKLGGGLGCFIDMMDEKMDNKGKTHIYLVHYAISISNLRGRLTVILVLRMKQHDGDLANLMIRKDCNTFWVCFERYSSLRQHVRQVL